MSAAPIYLDTSTVLRAWLETGTSPEVQARGIDEVWARCDVWDLTREVYDLARTLTPSKPLRALDALHLATFVMARRKIEGLEMLTTDRRLAEVSGLV